MQKKYFQRIVIISIIVISLASVNLNINSNIRGNPINSDENALNMNAITKDNYTEILTTNKYSLGNITVDDIGYIGIFEGLVNENVYHPLVTEDLIDGSLSIDTIDMDFLETTNPASVNFLDDNPIKKDYATYTFNESLKVWYNETQARYLIYHSRFTNTKLLNFYIDNGNVTTELIEDIDYTFDERNYIIFYYEDYFQAGRDFNFTMHLIWEHFMGFANWQIEQMEDNFFIIDEVEQEVTAQFNYNFLLVAHAFDQSILETVPISFWYVALTISPLDKDEFNDHALMLNGIEMNIGDYLTPEKSFQIELSDGFVPDSSSFSLNFTANYVVRFEDRVGDFWAVDRLVNLRSIRERIYLCNLISGPRHIYLKNIMFYESAIYFEEVLDSYSLFDRYVEINELNVNISGYKGLNVTVPYLYVGETSPLLIKYSTFQRLKIIITDDIKMPLVGAKIEVFHFGAIYGTYISNTSSQPISPSRSDENGQIILDNVPRGNYTIRVFWQGSFVEEASISTYNEINYIHTRIPHSPLWIIIFGVITGSILIIGAIFYQKYKKLR